MKMRRDHIAFLLAMTLMAGAPSNVQSFAQSLRTGTLGEAAKGAGVRMTALLPLGRAAQIQSNYIHVHYRKDVMSCAGERSAAAEKDEKDKSAVDLGHAIPPLIAWIVAKTHWTSSAAPTVRFVSQAQIDKMYTGGQPSNLVAHSLYCEDDHAIYLPDGWNPNSLLDRSELLHELVHHLQYLNHVPATCPAEYEWQAYKLQAAWLHDQGVEDPLALMSVAPETIYLLSHCPEF